MHDSHCHIDAYPHPEVVAAATEKARIFTVAVTNLPSAFFQGEPYLRGFPYVKLAVGLHPLLAEHHSTDEKRLFVSAIEKTDFVGEIGLDLSKTGRSTREKQLSSFVFALETMSGRNKVMTLHSRGAEDEVRRLLSSCGVSPAIFHWYSGGVSRLDRILSDGHYFSVNPRMAVSVSGLRIIKRIPSDRILLETDGPFCKIAGRPAMPSDTHTVCSRLAELWNMSPAEVTAVVDGNFERMRLAALPAQQ